MPRSRAAVAGIAMLNGPVEPVPASSSAPQLSLARFMERERGREAALPHTFFGAVTMELRAAFIPPFQLPIAVMANGLLVTAAWFLLPRELLFSHRSTLAFPIIMSAWMYADVAVTNVLAPDRVRVLKALDDPPMLGRLLLAKN